VQARHRWLAVDPGKMPLMIRLIGLCISIGLADSLNPTTIAPALYLAASERPRERVVEFTIGVFLVYFVGGAAIALGPGQLLLSLVPHPDHEDKAVIEIVAGAAMLVAAVWLWRHRERLSNRKPPEFKADGKSSWILGATITAIELPTAFPYFAAIAAIVGSDLNPVKQVLLLLLFNVCFVLPLIGIVLTLTFYGDHAEQVLGRIRGWLQRHWPVLLALVAVIAGAVVIALGLTGLSRAHPALARKVKRLIPLQP
jgi:cytochrome c biogenesis protein CcdA